MLKPVVERPDWLHSAGVEDLYSVSACITGSLANDLPAWELNGFGWGDSPEHLTALADGAGAAAQGMTLFYYELFEEAYDEEKRIWASFAGTVTTEPPVEAVLEGFDVACFSSGWAADCSPLSCNHLANTVPVNRHCLFDTLEDAKAALTAGTFDNSEPGPFRIVAVHRVPAALTLP